MYSAISYRPSPWNPVAAEVIEMGLVREPVIREALAVRNRAVTLLGPHPHGTRAAFWAPDVEPSLF